MTYDRKISEYLYDRFLNQPKGVVEELTEADIDKITDDLVEIFDEAVEEMGLDYDDL
jgi:hypothetical protein